LRTHSARPLRPLNLMPLVPIVMFSLTQASWQPANHTGLCPMAKDGPVV
jgi:hypothetical protein